MPALAEDASIHVDANQVLHTIPTLLTGACIEDVNHEIYGGLYSQMIFGESFQEPAPDVALKEFKCHGGHWKAIGKELHFKGDQGDKLVSDFPAFSDGEIGVEAFIPDSTCHNIGLIVRVNNAGNGMDHFDGYEIALNAAKKTLLLGRHRQNWTPIAEIPCSMNLGQWNSIKVRLEGPILEVFINNQSVIKNEDKDQPLLAGCVGLRAFQNEAQYRNLWVKTNETKRELAFEPVSSQPAEISGMWREVKSPNATGTWSLETTNPFKDRQSQRITFTSGTGSIGVENQGLNRWGLHFVAGKPYEGFVWLKSEKAGRIWVSLESADGSAIQAGKALAFAAGEWQKLTFTLTPKTTITNGRFAISLKQPGSVVLGHVFLQPGEWGRFKGLPVRKDVAEGLIHQGIRVLRYGGSMVNVTGYRWKNMIGQRERRPGYKGMWYEYSSNGWGILDFMNFCETAGFEYIPDFHLGETPQDMADFIEYAKGPSTSEWGQKRAADGHPQPYQLHYIQLGNEERVDENYADKFEALAKAIWAKDPNIILIVGDFCYSTPITDPNHVEGSAAGLTNLNGQKRILQLAKQYQREVWFDLHVGTDGPLPDSTLEAMYSFRNALAKMAEGARFKVVVFELNAGNHTQRRALANAIAIQSAERDGDLPIMTSANCLQPDGQNDNGWDQGLLFLNPSKVWLQPPGYITQIIAAHYQPLLVKSSVESKSNDLDVVAKTSADRKQLVIQVVNVSGDNKTVKIHLGGFNPTSPLVNVTELCASINSRNNAQWTNRVVPNQTQWESHYKEGKTSYCFPPHSFTVMKWE